MENPPDLNLLPVLLKVYDLNSVSAAAAHLGKSQSTISAALAKLRALYGDPLFHRAGHRMEPTARMRGLIEPVREALSRVNGTFDTEPIFNPWTTQHTFTFAMSELGEMVLLPKLLHRIHELAPRAAVRSVAVTKAEIERELETGEIDLVIGYFPYLRNKSFMEKHLFFDHFVCFLRADHPITAATLTIAQFRRLEHAVVYSAGRTYEIFERLLRSKKIHRRIALHMSHLMTIPLVISESDLVVTVPHAVGVFVKKMHVNLRTVRPPIHTPRIDLKMHWHRNFQHDEKARWLRDVVSSLFTDDSDEWRS